MYAFSHTLSAPALLLPYKNVSTRRDINTIISYYTTHISLFFSSCTYIVYDHASHMLSACDIWNSNPARAFNIRQPYSANDSPHNDSSNYEIGVRACNWMAAIDSGERKSIHVCDFSSIHLYSNTLHSVVKNHNHITIERVKQRQCRRLCRLLSMTAITWIKNNISRIVNSIEH